MADFVTSSIELMVGIACLGMALPAWRRGAQLRWVGARLAMAGFAAAAHAVVALVR